MHGAFNGFGRTTRKVLHLLKSVIMVTRFLLVVRNVGGSVFSAIVGLQVITLASIQKARSEKNWHLFAVVNYFFQLMYQLIEISVAEPVTFSGRIQLLVAKFGRSSKLSPRFIVVVSYFQMVSIVLVLTVFRLLRRSTFLLQQSKMVSRRQLSRERCHW